MISDRFAALSPRVQKHAGLLFLTFFSIFTYGYLFRTQPNLDQILPFVNKLRDPSLFPADLYIGTCPAFPSLFPLVMSADKTTPPLPPYRVYLVNKNN